jgi:hypothetical protein
VSTYRQVERARHIDDRLVAVGPIARAVWDYLCCNQQDHASGLYRLSIATACEDTGWDAQQIEGALVELEGVALIERDTKRRLVWVRNMLRKSYRNITAKQRIGVENHLRSMPETPLIGRLIEYYLERWNTKLVVADEAPRRGLGTPLEGGSSVSGSGSVSGSVSESVSDRKPDVVPETRRDPDDEAKARAAALRFRGEPKAPPPEFDSHEWHYRWEAIKSELNAPHLPNPLSNAAKRAGALEAVAAYDVATVLQVVDYTARQAAAGHIPAVFLGKIFAGGFEARLEAWAKSQPQPGAAGKPSKILWLPPIPGLEVDGGAS